MISGYTETSERWARRNDLHVRMVEQAGEDRVLFQNTKPHDHVDMRFPEYVAFLPHSRSWFTRMAHKPMLKYGANAMAGS
jgi:hypothetical protein